MVNIKKINDNTIQVNGAEIQVNDDKINDKDIISLSISERKAVIEYLEANHRLKIKSSIHS